MMARQSAQFYLHVSLGVLALGVSPRTPISMIFWIAMEDAQ